VDALQRYNEVWPKALALVPKGDIVAELRHRRAECYYLLGRFEEAYAEAETGLNHCRELGDRYEEAATYRVLALAAAALGRPAEAKRWFNQGFAYYDDIETPYEWGKLWMSYGDWLSGPHAGEFADKKGALEAYQAAFDHFERMGAKAKLAEASARLASLRPAQATASIPVATEDSTPQRRPLRKPRQVIELEQRSQRAFDLFGIVTRSRLMLDLLDDVTKLAKSTTPILVLGESGTGKELIANGVHKLSGRSGNFVPINCGALPREIIESELFGHVVGAFTGATRDKPGLFEVCDNGTVFLDEIAEMSAELQSRLLRFLETGESRRVGGTRSIAVNTRIVAATNRDRASLENGEGFRTDLYYRLAHAVIVLPPLRRRGEDIALLVDHFFAQSCKEERKHLALSETARRRLIAHPWPGNVRQLRAVLRRAVILAADHHEIAADELELSDGQVATTLLEELEQAERRRVSEALQQARGSRTEAAKALGMPRTTFINKMKRYGLM
jgi:transcriptional regulator with PAS, ATPase and Fis domain